MLRIVTMPVWILMMLYHCSTMVSAGGYGGGSSGSGSYSSSAGDYGTKTSSGSSSTSLSNNFYQGPQMLSPSSVLAGPLFKMSPKKGYQPGQVVQAAVQTKHEIEFRDVPTTGEVVPTTIEVGANSVPLNILFRSASSSLNIQQSHDGAQGSVQETQSEDEPHRLIHSVKKPIIQEVHEVITPFRKITQEIQPVQEEILTIVARGKDGPDGGFSDKMFDTKGKSSSPGKHQPSTYGTTSSSSIGDTSTTISSRTKGGY